MSRSPSSLYKLSTAPLRRAFYLIRACTRYCLPREAAPLTVRRTVSPLLRPPPRERALPRLRPDLLGVARFTSAWPRGSCGVEAGGRAARGPSPLPHPHHAGTQPLTLTMAAHGCPPQAAGRGVKAFSRPRDSDGRRFNDAVPETGDKNPLIRGEGRAWVIFLMVFGQQGSTFGGMTMS